MELYYDFMPVMRAYRMILLRCKQFKEEDKK
jgi:hypothetical protein